MNRKMKVGEMVEQIQQKKNKRGKVSLILKSGRVLSGSDFGKTLRSFGINRFSTVSYKAVW